MYNIEESKERIEKVLSSFKIGHSDIKHTAGPTFTLFEFYPQIGVRMSKIANLKNEFSSALRTSGVRVIAPTETGTIGIEVPNTERETVDIMEMLYSDEYMNTDMTLPLCMGRKVDNSIFMADLTTMPHLLVAGATGMGKSVGLNVIITSLLRKKTPDELKLVLIDPKKVELSLYAGLEKSYLATPVITETNDALTKLAVLCDIMDSRYALLKGQSVRSIGEYNALVTSPAEKLPYIVVVIDEYADLAMTAGRSIEYYVCRLAQKARAVGIHVILATQRPDTKVITGNIKANFPTRIAFRTATGTDSRVILDRVGAERLTGRGDMLYFSDADLTRVQCAYISTEQVMDMCEMIAKEYKDYDPTCQPIQPVVRRLYSEVLPITREVAGVLPGWAYFNSEYFDRSIYNSSKALPQLQEMGIVDTTKEKYGYRILVTDPAEIERILNHFYE